MVETVPSGTILHGHYRIERALGSGGFGHVYLAVDLTTNQQYAIKEYLVTGNSGQEQLKHEATVLNQLHHPNIPAFHAAFIEGDRYYVVLKYIEGYDLTDLIKRSRLIPIAQIMSWLLSISDAVQFLHSQHPIVIHRDIKPDNIRITPNGTAILVDLGNAKTAADGARTLLFIRHQGTPGYAPPEQYPGGSGTDARSDIYALGGTLYFALTGQEPPSVSTRNQLLQQGKPDLPSLQERLANNPPETDPANDEIRNFRLGSKPAKPAPRHSRHVAQLGTLPPELLDRLNRIIQQAMAIKPKDRYQFVADFAQDLKSVMAALPVPPSSPPSLSHELKSTQPSLPNPHNAQPNPEMPNKNILPTPSHSAQTMASAPQTSSCPQCKSSLAPHAIFCPQCGTPLTHTPTSHEISKDISAEQTFVGVIPAHLLQKAAPHAQEAPSRPPLPSRTPPTSHHNFTSAVPTRQSVQTTTHAQKAPFSQVIPTDHAPSGLMTQTGSSPNQSSSLLSSRINTKMVIFIAVILVVLIVVIAIFITSQGHRGSINLHGDLQWFGLKAQEFSYERNFSFGLTPPTTFALAGIW